MLSHQKTLQLIRWALGKLFSVGGVLGLALSLFFYRHWRRRNSSRDGSPDVRTGPQGSHAPKRGESDEGRREARDPCCSRDAVQVPSVHLPQLITARYRKPSLVLSIPSILTLESGPIHETATAHEPTVRWLKEQVMAGPSQFKVYLVCQVVDDVGEAVVSGMLEHCGIVPMVVPQHRVLFVEDVKSTVSVVRQLDPGAYVGVDEGVCAELQRFYKERGRILCVKDADWDTDTNSNADATSRLHVGLFASKN
jgi:hypothetical protein